MDQLERMSKRDRWLAWGQLLRIPNVFTAIADVSMGYLVAEQGATRPLVWASLVAISGCLYSAGMVLNDLFDVEVDRRERPRRPLPSGRIPLSQARFVGLGLMLAGVLLAAGVQWIAAGGGPAWFQPLPVGISLATCVLLYDRVLKASWAGPLAMGACRTLNVLLGMSVTQSATMHGSATPLMIAGAYGVYVMGITWFARHEAGTSPRQALFLGLALMLLGVGVLTLVPYQHAFPRTRVVLKGAWVWPVLVWLLTAPVWRRALMALSSQSSRHVQSTVKQALLTLIVLDAAVALVVAGPALALGVLALSIPSRLLARKIYVT